jgi:GNAT superfamily N-acetyltransferase
MSQSILNSNINKVHFDCLDSSPSDELILELASLSASLFERTSDTHYFKRLSHKKSPLLILARSADNTLIACKIGYEYSDDVFYSWFGGVRPDYRKQGIAQSLMDIQHSWCKQHQFSIIRTKCQITNTIMYSLNVNNGFSIIGNDFSDIQQPKFLFSKILTSHSNLQR